ncbi:MAG: aminotransferase DegT [Crocinitomicaceae bacterium]|nr:aminotransferase DegT [Crocinitomicaceae bacterium]|tara:strand:- start:14203 stop:15339 length:1137 start_codon:yes stop_codon:yes gene_type:complete
MNKEIIQFIRKKFKSQDFIQLHCPVFKGNEIKYLKECVDTTYVSSVGPFVDKFEILMNSITQTNKTTAVVNGTAGLQVALRLVGVKKNDEVITQALTFVATANSIAYNNAHPIFLDVDYDTMGLSPTAVSDFLDEFGELRDDGCYNKSTGRKISACMPMHTFGFPVHLDELIKICHLWKIPIVEDAAESLGSQYKGMPTGSFGKVGAFSFNGNKIVTAGAGGAITTKNIALGDRAKFLTTTAKEPHKYEFIHNELGYNFRMPNINAALACAQLEQLPSFLENKRMLAKDYQIFFKKKGIKFRTETQGTKANYWLMCIELENKTDYNYFLKDTNKSNIMTRPVWELMSKLPMYSHCQRDSQKNAIKLKDRIINIPSGVR